MSTALYQTNCTGIGKQHFRFPNKIMFSLLELVPLKTIGLQRTENHRQVKCKKTTSLVLRYGYIR